jgi:hypothetical protein
LGTGVSKNHLRDFAQNSWGVPEQVSSWVLTSASHVIKTRPMGGSRNKSGVLFESIAGWTHKVDLTSEECSRDTSPQATEAVKQISRTGLYGVAGGGINARHIRHPYVNIE